MTAPRAERGDMDRPDAAQRRMGADHGDQAVGSSLRGGCFCA